MIRTHVEEKLCRLFEKNGIAVYNINSDRFKTNTINIFFQDNLNKDSVALNALFPSVLRRGCKGLPTIKEINLYLEKLYGAVFDCGIVKKGERQIIHFYFEYISDKYTNDSQRNFEKAFEFLMNIIFRPELKDGTFNEQYVEQEKNNLKMIIEGRTNDKVQYSMERCYELMCMDEPFGLYEYGTVEQIDEITNDRLYEHYKKKIESLPAEIFITGEIDDKDIAFIKEKLSKVERSTPQKLNSSIILKCVKDVREYEDKMDVNQAKLCMGFRTHVQPADNDYYALMVFSGLLGGGMHSKLFQNVREKAGLAYYVFAGLEKFKGLMVIASGIDINNKNTAQEIIMKQLDEIRLGNITEYEFEATLKSLKTGIMSLKDSQLYVVDFYLSQLINGTHDTMETLVEKINRVTVDDIIKVANKVQLDTVYFLTSKSHERIK
ncbi:EF-P 5-aminopentanol modification-associated protein YfmF [Ruminiclostridium cellulolyticum]|uniref:Peptidase M16 domain protein n=1 Tax=Ruminiclostridium cellulolyticum (strain ATCC 35319 / DSM 5812 / JCM 6584 / H10) TaxID=394503 RepID=B8I6G1_RUMCH|nr:pitrilysin family protein [Ruminiclostridium cellulolyticum]ACL74853.1 peptidase M16 domain protein [Ruminiclostridium cellulolyticum H10]